MTPDRGSRCIGWLLLAWALYATVFVLTKPIQTGSHDFSGHLQYTDILMHQHRYPAPLEGWETHQMPLYYRINSLIRLPLVAHVQTVRLLSVLYGVAFLLIIAQVLRQAGISSSASLLAMGFIATTPKFVFLFSSYNNDSLATLLAGALLWQGWEFLRQPERQRGLFLMLIGVLGLYTKLTFVFALATLWGSAWGLAMAGRISRDAVKQLQIVTGVLLVLLLPWLYFHNVRATGRWIVPSGIRPEAALRHSPAATLLTPPTVAQWKDPYLHLPEAPKAGSFFSSVVASSVFGSATFPAMPRVVSWLILLGHVLLGVLVWKSVMRSGLTWFHGLSILGSALTLAAFLFACPTYPSMEFRFIAWSWLPWAVLLGSFLETAFQRWVGVLIAAQSLFLLIWLFLSGTGYL